MDAVEPLRMIASLLGVVALILALAWLARRAGWLRGQPAQNLRVLATQTLGGTRAMLALVQVEDARLVLGVTAAQVNVLHVLPGGQAVRQTQDAQHDEHPAHGSAFAAVLTAQQKGA